MRAKDLNLDMEKVSDFEVACLTPAGSLVRINEVLVSYKRKLIILRPKRANLELIDLED